MHDFCNLKNYTIGNFTWGPHTNQPQQPGLRSPDALGLLRCLLVSKHLV